jgi:membrane protein
MAGAMKKFWEEKIEFFRTGMWELERDHLSVRQRALLRLLQACVIVVDDFRRDRCMLRASALTFTSLLSLIPLLALMFAVLKGLNVQNTLQPFILDKLAVGSQHAVEAIVTYINNTHFGRLGMFGLLALIASVIALLSNIEESFNHICGVRETRTLFRKFADYSSIILIGPILLVAAISMTTTLQSQAFVQKLLDMAFWGDLIYLSFQVVPYVVMWLAFTVLYIFMPNVRINFGAALIGGVIGGTLWQLAQYGYVNFQVGVARYNAIYGTMAALPIFMIWLYISWLIVLLGLEITYVCQHLRVIRRERRGYGFSMFSRELVAVAMLLKICQAFMLREKNVTLDQVSEALRVPIRFSRNVLEDLISTGLVVRIQDGGADARLQPAVAPEVITVSEILSLLRNRGGEADFHSETPVWLRAKELEGRLQLAEEEVLDGMTLHELVESIQAVEEEPAG